MLLKRKWIGYYKLVRRYKLIKGEVKCIKCPKKTFCMRTSSLFEYCYRVNRLFFKDGLCGDSCHCYIAIDDSMTKKGL